MRASACVRIRTRTRMSTGEATGERYEWLPSHSYGSARDSLRSHARSGPIFGVSLERGSARSAYHNASSNTVEAHAHVHVHMHARVCNTPCTSSAHTPTNARPRARARADDWSCRRSRCCLDKRRVDSAPQVRACVRCMLCMAWHASCGVRMRVVCVCARVHACVHACVCACVCAYVHGACREVEAHLGQNISRAVLAVPVDFDDAARQRLKEAAHAAGLSGGIRVPE